MSWWRDYLRTAGCCGEEGLEHVEILKTELGEDSDRLVEASGKKCCAVGCTTDDGGRHDGQPR